LRFRPPRGQSQRDTGGKPAPANRHDHGLDVVQLLRQLEAERSLARDDHRIVERMHDRRARLRSALAGMEKGVIDELASEHHLGTVAPRRLDLGERSVCRHEDACGNPCLASSPRDRLAVVARTRGDHPRLSLRIAQRG
jgi:hypothetical protein